MNEHSFGGFLSLDISAQKNMRVNKIRVHYYTVTINKLKYIELLLNSSLYIISSDVLTIIKDKMGSKKCFYKDLHEHDTISDICDTYMSDDEDIL